MTETKKNFIKTGSILAVIASIFIALFGFVMIPVACLIDEDFVIATYKSEPGYAYHEELDGGYYIEYTDVEDGIVQVYKVTDEDIKLVATVGRVMSILIATFCIGLGVAEFVLAVLIMNKLAKNKQNKGLIIAMLVISGLTGSVVTFAFMIVALCLKDKKPTLENINEIAMQNQVIEKDESDK